MKPTTVGLTTVGCKLNQYETQGIAELMESSGFRIVPFAEAADVYIVNTCTVTSRSDCRSRQMLRRAARTNPGAIVVATGCYAQRDAPALEAMPEVHIVAGNSEKPRIASLVLEFVAAAATAPGRRTVVAVGPVAGPSAFEPLDVVRFRGYTRAFVKVQDGCDGLCAYCAVPGARGPARSRPFDDVVAQTRRLAAAGHREVVLTGVHIGAYRTPEGGLPELLRALVGIGDLGRIRLGSVEPRELTSELAATIADLDKIAKHLHVPLESGSDRVLSAMRRNYSRAEYAAAVRQVTDRVPGCGLGADVMVGFPGETDGDFADTVALIRDLPFTYLHVFAFSPRGGTEAADMKGGLPPHVKRERSRTLRDLGKRKSLEFRRGLIGSRVDVLAEAPTDEGSRALSGLASNYVRVRFPADPGLAGRIVQVRIDGADGERTWGTVCPDEP
jgi:threonylcarbamoyladenosine tRNA methylthiotransferase MtaB